MQVQDHKALVSFYIHRRMKELDMIYEFEIMAFI